MFVVVLGGCGGNSSNDSVNESESLYDSNLAGKDGQVDGVLVYINDSAIQCEYAGDSPEVTANTLIEAGIDVLESDCGYISGLVTPAVCGIDTDGINIHKIRSVNLGDAEALGFSPVSTLETESGIGFEVIDCETRM